MTQRLGHPYSDLAYAQTLAQHGAPLFVNAWDCPVLLRVVPGSEFQDALGVYPRAALTPRSNIKEGLAELNSLGAVSVTVVPDPCVAPSFLDLQAGFMVCRPFKTHYVIDRALGRLNPTKHHRYRIRRAVGKCRVEIVALKDHLETWSVLYNELVVRRAIAGPGRFSENGFKAMSELPGLHTFAAYVDNSIVGMSLWLVGDRAVYNHLTATSAVGRKNLATYAMYGAAIEHFASESLIDLGATSGLGDNGNDGLGFFKRGFSNGTRTAYLCGHVLKPRTYNTLSSHFAASDYFPAYRAPASTPAAT